MEVNCTVKFPRPTGRGGVTARGRLGFMTVTPTERPLHSRAFKPLPQSTTNQQLAVNDTQVSSKGEPHR